ncbi:MAG TPA: PAS domain S-box protein [Candidatus Aquilonibacter sp.]|nr:PAS domain S-box protein [Candidatus Aquilonibacter sp.]
MFSRWEANNRQLPGIRQVERGEWSLSWTAISVTLLLTGGIASFAWEMLRFADFQGAQFGLIVRGLVGAVLLFDVYVIYQQHQLQKIRRRLTEREEFFQLISENVADMIAVVDASGKRLYNSPSYHRVLGYTQEELKSIASLEQIHPDDQQLVSDVIAETRRTGIGRRIEFRMRHKHGHWVHLESTASVVPDASGHVDRLIVVNREISERRRLEEQLRQSQKMEAIGRLSGGVAHDFNNLLGVIIGYGEILEERIDSANPLRASVDQILKAGRRAASLTRQLLAFSRQQVLEPKVLRLNAVVADMEKMLRRMIGEDVELTISLGPSLGRIRADQGQIEQVIMNLAVNSRDAMPNGGKLVIETMNFEIDRAFAARYAYPVLAGPYILLTVADSGTGMDAATQQRIFEPFFTTKEKGKGTGLGLSTVYGVVKQSSGYIDVYSTLGKGTTFNIYLPRTDSSEGDDGHDAGPATATRGTETILLVEDEDTLRALTKNLLELNGYTVLEAANGAAALEISDRAPGEIHLLLTDVVMPGINGRVLADQLKSKRPGIKTMFMSGYTGQRVGEETIFRPGTIFLQKPFSREQLARKVRDALEVNAATHAPQAV